MVWYLPTLFKFPCILSLLTKVCKERGRCCTLIIIVSSYVSLYDMQWLICIYKEYIQIKNSTIEPIMCDLSKRFYYTNLLHGYVQLGCPTLIHQHSTLFWICLFITITKYINHYPPCLLYIWINQVVTFCMLILT
jgi:hypothetical protein